MRNLLFLALALSLFLLLCGCNRKPVKVVVPPLPRVETEEVASPPNQVATLSGGSNLQEVANAAYGHEDFSGFVASLNGITDSRRVPAGTILETPSLAVGLRDAGLDPVYQPAINVLAQCWSELRSALPQYESQRDAAGARDGNTFSVTPDLRRRLSQCADAVDAALDVLAHPNAGHKSPRSAIGKFTEVSSELREFAAGRVNGVDYGVFLTEKRIGSGFNDLLIWAQSHHR